MRQPAPDILRTLTQRPTQPLENPDVTQPSRDVPETHHLSMGPQPPSVGTSLTRAPWDSQDFDIFLRPTETQSNSWAVCWSDLMMTMFIMFAALYAFQLPRDKAPQVIPDVSFAPAAVYAPVPPPDDSPLVRFHDQAVAAIQRANLESVVTVRLVPEKSVHLVVDGDQFFDPGKSLLKVKGLEVVRVLSAALRQSPHVINVGGYVAQDDANGPPSWELGTARAIALTRALVRDASLPRERMVLLGHAHPAASPHDFGSSNRDWTRRAEIVVSLEDVTAPLPGAGHDRRMADGIAQWIVSPRAQGE